MKSLSLSAPHLIVVVGIPGAGKSFFAKQFADMFHAPLLSSDPILRAIPDSTPEVIQAISDSLTSELLPQLLKTQKTILLDGSGAMRNQRLDLQRLARQAGYDTLLVWIQTDAVTAKMRCVKPPRGSEKAAITPDDYDAMARKFSAPHPSEKYIVLSGKHTYASQAKMLLRKLSEPRAAAASAVKPHTPTEPPKRSTGNRISIS